MASLKIEEDFVEGGPPSLIPEGFTAIDIDKLVVGSKVWTRSGDMAEITRIGQPNYEDSTPYVLAGKMPKASGGETKLTWTKGGRYYNLKVCHNNDIFVKATNESHPKVMPEISIEDLSRVWPYGLPSSWPEILDLANRAMKDVVENKSDQILDYYEMTGLVK